MKPGATPNTAPAPILRDGASVREARSASVYLRDAKLFVVTLSWTGALWVHDGPCDSLDSSASTADKGLLLSTALGRSRVVAPPDGDALGPLLRASGVKSWSTFVRGTKSVDVEWERRESTEIVDWRPTRAHVVGYTMTPMRNLGPRRGFEFLHGPVYLAGEANVEELGSALERAFERAVA